MDDRGRSVAVEVPAEVVGPLRPHLESAAEEIVREIQGLVPEYDRPAESGYGQRMRWAVGETVRCFVDAIGPAEMDWRPLTEIYAGIGAYEAGKGRSLDGLQTAIRVSGQVACRRFIRDARRLDWSLQTLGQVTESLFVYMEKLASAAAQGYSAAQEQLVTERERARWRLRDLLIAEPPASRTALVELARSAGWEPPRTIAVVAVRPRGGELAPVLPPALLADWHAATPYVVVPDPDGPGQARTLASLVAGSPAAVGPTVPLTRGALSLRWALRALGLIDRGIIPGTGPVRCLDHIPALVMAMGEDLLSIALGERLTALMALPPNRRMPLARTLLAYMENGDNAVAAAERLAVHQQTVRYRLRRLEELLGDTIHDPGRRVEIMMLLYATELPSRE